MSEERNNKEKAECGADPDSRWVNMQVADKHNELYPHNSRDTSAEILGMVQSSTKPLRLQNGIDFAGDSLFCEFAYVADLDKNTLEVFKGFNELEPVGRFAELEPSTGHDGTVYYPVSPLAEFDLSDLPTREAFLEACRTEEDD